MIRVASCFAQVLAMVDRYGFDRAVLELDAERGAKGFRSWDQFVAMLFCQLGSADSLREICGGLSTSLGRMVHLALSDGCLILSGAIIWGLSCWRTLFVEA